MNYILRDHFMDSFENRKVMIQKAADFLNVKYGENTVQVEVTDSYFNMLEKFEESQEFMTRASFQPEVRTASRDSVI